MIVGYENSEIFIYTCYNWRLYSKFNKHTERVRCLEVSLLNNNIFASGGLDHKIVIWDINEKKDIALLEGHTDWVKSIIFSKDQQQLFSTGDDTKIAKWNISNL